ncbi:FG-GAP-like repeat-containing protein [Aquimarina sp. 2201CG5-10]|uniref:FG-GAP-like repeat-containing protein n=1 Tax=Aquimarina callyspongiae TaxID=3098150 RepID=UPI002AB5BC48|nr:FG-GAP-like repeat-containing protein [Aquimarina sp. 2201CG5-10]MDY8134325.1 FG-GAP-like repeat-containing protein [Aquimarina sp. 2201CG5-10]
MKKLLLCLCPLISFWINAQTFTELATANLTDVAQSAVAWGDYDDDGDLDLLLTGWTGSTRVSKIYTNTAGTFTELATANLTDVNNSAVAWGDYDNDGDLDIVLTGSIGSTTVSKIYTNTAGTFTELVTANLTGITNGAVAWGDYDNDGDLDILLTGFTGSATVSKIYTNTAGIFTELATANLTGVTDGAVAWGDYDNDGDLDIVLTGSAGGSRISKIYTNTAGTFTELATANLAQVSFSSVDWGDYDNDGDLDILLTGIEGSTASASISKIYTNTAGTFTELATANLTAVNVGAALWGDYDNDGDLDVLLNGWTASGNISKIYTNTAGAFTELATANLPGAAFGRSAWGDYDNDGDLDILLTGEFPVTSKIFTNNTVTLNTAPTAPTNPTAVVNKDEVTVSWTASTDAETPSSGLSYNVYIKDASTSSAYTVSPMAQENNGWRKLPARGNAQQNTSYRWKLPLQYHGIDTNFTFKVQAIDHSFTGSAFSTEGTFSVDLSPFVELNTPGLSQLENSSVAWGDYDNDGDLDILITGTNTDLNGGQTSKIYTNTAGVFTELASANIPGVAFGRSAWGDYDNDGDLDILLTGQSVSGNISKIYTNTAGVFTELATANLTGIGGSSVAWGDYDNDGDLDIILTGGTSKIYTNTAGTFTELATANLPRVDNGSVAWGDYDNDGDLDILLTGFTGSADISKIYTNTGGVFTELITANLTGVSFSAVAWGDYDNDGDLDILLAGYTGSSTVSKIYTNTSGSFTELATANLPGLQHSSAAWGDYDNDGDLDILLTGIGGSTEISKIYTNTAGTFAELTTANLTGVRYGSATWGDYDNDNDLDILLTGELVGGRVSKIYTNNTVTSNTIPTAPTNPTAVVNRNEVTLSWTASTDTETPSGGLSYNVFIKENPVALPIYAKSPMAQENDGWRKLPAIGNAGQNTSYVWKLPQEYLNTNKDFTFKIQAIDHSFAGSEFSTEGTFSIVDLRNFIELDTANLTNVFQSAVAWGDYDNDGDLDLLVSGKKSISASTDPISTIYTNNNGTFTALATANLIGVQSGAVEWGDYDNDGDLDLLITGLDIGNTLISKIYTNTGGSFTELATANLPGIAFGDVAWGDYDNDGDLDIFLTGGISKIYTNDAGTFTELTTASFPRLSSGSVEWGDYDNDGDLDVLLTGYTGSLDISKIYTNNDGVFTELVSANLTGVSYSSTAWGDYDNDGDLDILLSGYTGSARVTKVYTNTAGSFTELATANLLGVQEGSAAWGDYDNDGDLDILLTGSGGGAKTRIYTNDAGVFTQLITDDLPGLVVSDGVWGDYDNDGDLDIALSGVTNSSFISKIYINNIATSNTIPTAPTNPAAVVNGDVVTLSWTASTDTETSGSGLSYNVYIKENPVGMPIYAKTPMAQENDGWRKLPALGNVGQGTSYIYKLPAACTTNYTFKVQAIDHSFAGSAFSSEGSFSTVDVTKPSVVTQDITVQLDASGNASITPAQVDNGSSDNCGIQSMSLDTTSLNCTNIGVNTVTLTVTDVNGNSDTNTAIVTVEDNVLSSVVTQDITVQLDASGNASITPAQIDNGSSDNCGIQSMSLDVTSFDCTNIGTNTVILTVTDVNGNSDTNTATVTVEDNVAPAVITQNITVQLNASGNASITPAQIDNGSSDACGIQSMSLDITSFDCTNVGTNTVALTVTDVNGNSDTNTAIVTVEDNVLSSVVTQDITVQLDASGNASIAPAQIDNGSSDNCGIQSMSLDVTSFDCTNIGTNTVILTVTDVNGNSDTNTAIVTVEDNVLSSVVTQDITVQLDASGNASITPAQVDNGSSDNCGIQSMSLDVTSFDCTNIGTNTVILTVTDVNGNSDTNAATVTVEDNVSPVVLTQNITVQLDASGNASITTAQIDNGSSDACGIQLMSLDITSFDCTNVGTNTVALTVTDVNGNSDTNTATVIVEDTVGPSVVTQDITVQLDASGNANITAAQIDNGSSDNCGIQSMSLDTSSFDCINVGANTVTLTVTDVNGNSGINTAIVTVEDNVTSSIITQNITVQLDVSGNATISPAQIDNGSSDACGIQSMSLDVTNFDCTNIGTNTVTLTITDINGNSDTNTATVTVQDTIQPMVVCQDITIQLDATGNAAIIAADIDNGSNDACGVVLTLNKTQFSLAEVGVHTVTLTATDPSGNTNSCNALVTVEDNIPPVITLLGDDPQIITKGSGYTELGATTDDGSEVIINSSDFIDATGTYYISYNAIDSNGNMAEEVIRTVIVNNPNPILEVFPNPASDYIRILNFENLQVLEIYDMTGKKIYQFNEHQLQEYIKVDHLQEGVYWLRGYFISKGFVSKKIVIKH